MNDQEARSKDEFFKQLATISDAMSAAHGADFAMGALVLAARFIAERGARPAPPAPAAGASAEAAPPLAPPPSPPSTPGG